MDSWKHNGWAWVWVGVIMFATLSFAILQPFWLRDLPPIAQLWILGLPVAGAALVYFFSQRIAAMSGAYEVLHGQAEEADHLVTEAYQRLEAIFLVSQKLVEATDEREVVDLVMRLAVERVGAQGASFVPLDEHGQPSAAISHGQLPSPQMNDWVEYLATPGVRDRCRTCDHHGTLTNPCPLVSGPFAAASGAFCLPLRRGEREFGVLNLYMPQGETPDEQTRAFLRAMADETALALEGVRLRRRELEALRQMQAVRQKTDQTALLTGLLESIQTALEADFCVLELSRPLPNDAHFLSLGNVPEAARPIVLGVLQGVMNSGQPVMVGGVQGDPATTPEVRSLMAAPLLAPDRSSLGALVVGQRRLGSFHPRQLSLLQTIAGQAALVVQNANQMAEMEYKTLLEERTRLAREIHDGLAQTLGFLKLQMAQMQNYVTRSDWERLGQSINLSYTTLSEAYQDVRQTIDGLRISPQENGLAGWLEQSAADFHDLTDLPVHLEMDSCTANLRPEVHAQLIRIVQEALSNVRKHAQAQEVWIACSEDGQDLWLEVRDDGQGFAPEDVSEPSRHGLRGMRERSELIGADFQVISRPGQGAKVMVRLPLQPAVVPGVSS